MFIALFTAQRFMVESLLRLLKKENGGKLHVSTMSILSCG